MSEDHEGHEKQYLLTSETYYPWTRSRDEVDEVYFGYYQPGEGTSGEMSVIWKRLEDGKPPVPCLKCYNDAWHALSTFKDVIDAMAEVDNEAISPHEFCCLLEQCGFVDRTPRQVPAGETPHKHYTPLQASVALRDIIEAEGMKLSEDTVEKLDAIATALQGAGRHDEL